MLRRLIAGALVCALTSIPRLPAQSDETHYRKPPPAIEAALSAPALPVTLVVPGNAYVAQLAPVRYPPVAELARPMLRLAGLRIDPATNGIHHVASFNSLAFVRVRDGVTTTVTMPAGTRITNLRFSPDGSRWAAYQPTNAGTRLWTGSVGSPQATMIANASINGVFASALAWMPDNARLVVPLVDRVGPAPGDGVASGPAIQESNGTKSELRTFEDLLQNPQDEARFTYYATSRLAIVDARTGTVTKTAARGIFADVSPAPDATALLVERVHAPYSYLVPVDRFPHASEIRDLRGTLVRTVVDAERLESADDEAVTSGARDVAWDPNSTHALLWLEALRNSADGARDRIVRDENGTTRELVRSPERIRSVSALDGDPRLLVGWYQRARRTRTLALVDPSGGTTPRVLFTLKDGDAYNDPGTPLLHQARNGESVVAHDGNTIWLRGAGRTPDGDRPFLDRYDLQTGATSRVFRSELQPLENALTPLDTQGSTLLAVRQSLSEPPNVVVRTVASGQERALTHVTDPFPLLRSVRRRVVKYKRDDGVDLSFTLYTPPNWDGKTALPTFLWAYPLEYIDRDTASQSTNSAQTFATPSAMSAVMMVLAGYAVLDNAAIPIVGDPKTVNDTYVQQLTAGAKAAIDEAARIGVTDPNRVAVGGHSYGAFMTANLLVHTSFFRAGIARSGAYNRTLTPFGFQSERRTYWQARDLYTTMSPFTFADQLKAPLLLVHGEADDNSGTFPIQSERFYAAIKGNGGTARLVMLPYEAHGYLGRESLETMLAEMVDWLDRFVKPVKSAGT